MKNYNNSIIQMNEELYNELKTKREKRSFNSNKYLANKVKIINEYFDNHQLTDAVIGLSGGIDSAICLALLTKAMNDGEKGIKAVHPILLPAINDKAMTNQDKSITNAKLVCEKFSQIPKMFHKLSQLTEIVTSELTEMFECGESDWARGQLVSYLRTPILYNACSILTDMGKPAIVIGTTNLSEGGYIGYVGKASDGMTDLQIISDLYKNDVFEVAKELDIPKEIIKSIPNGDMFDGRSDEEVFGTSYDFLELYMETLKDGDYDRIKNIGNFKQCEEKIEKIHNYNSHKYQYSMPSVFLDLYDSSIPGGWNNTPWSGKNV